MQQAELFISTLSPDGLGLAQWKRPDGLVRDCLVHSSLPDETVEAEIIRIKRNKSASFAGKITSIKKASPFRVVPRCIHFGSCGGCVWQHMDYSRQLAVKEERLKKLFGDAAAIMPIIPCEPVWNYRNKMEFSFSEDCKGQKFLGLILQGSKGRVFKLKECHLMNPWVAHTVTCVYNWWVASDLMAYYMPKDKGTLRNLTMRESQATKDRLIILTVSGNPDYAIKRHLLESFVETCVKAAAPEASGQLSIILRIQQVHKGRPTEIFEMRLYGPDTFRERVKVGDQEFEFHLSPSSFFQPNAHLANTLYQKALELADLSQDVVFYDLFAGIGIFGMLASPFVKEAIAIELSADAAYDATVNSKRLGLQNFRMIQGDVAKVLEAKELPKADVAIVDPPRSGLTKAALKQVIKLAPKRLVYVSCNPNTQAQDIQELVANGMKLVCLQPIEQFPHTIHIETIALLERVSAQKN